MDDPDEDVRFVRDSRVVTDDNKQGWVKRTWRDIEVPLLIVGGFLALFLGAAGFYKHSQLSGEPFSIATAFYTSLVLFKLGGGNVASPVPWELEVARWLAPIVAMYAILLGLASLFRNQARLLRLRFSRGHVVICGLGQKGVSLVRSFRKAGHLVVAVEKDAGNPGVALCREAGAVVLIGDARDEFVLCKAGVKRARYLIGVCRDDGTNADIALVARKLVEKRSGSKLSCSLHIQDPRLWVFLRTQEFGAEQGASFRLDFFNIFDQGAKQLFREFPLSGRDDPVNLEPHILIVGFGGFAEQLIINAARQWAPRYEADGRQVRVSVIDPQAEVCLRKLCQEYSLVEKVCRWQVYPFDTSSIEYLEGDFLYNEEQEMEISSIFVTFEDETVSLSSALTLLEKVRSSDTEILVRMNEEKGLASLIRQSNVNDGSFDNLHLFGLLERTCQPELVYNSSHEAIARAIHEEYTRMMKGSTDLTPGSPARLKWEELPEAYREMNREQADSIGEKLNAIACDIAPWCDYGADKFTFSTEEVEVMSRMEHQRWCEQRLRHGWRYGPERDDRRKLHPSLVPWEDERLSEGEKEKDRNTVRLIPRYLALAGYQIYRVK